MPDQGPTTNSHDTDPCPDPPGSRPCSEARAEFRDLEQRLLDRILAEHQDTVRDVTARLEGFGAKLDAASEKLDAFTPQVEHAIHVARVAAELLPGLEKRSEDTLVEAINARLKAGEAGAQSRAAVARIDELARTVATSAGAKAGQEAGKAAGAEAQRGKHRTSRIIALAALVTALLGLVTELVKQHPAEVAPPPAASARP